MSDTAPRTYQTRILDGFDKPLSAYALLMSHVERCLFADIATGKVAGDLKSFYLTHFRITARQFNAARVQLEGKIDSILRLQSQRIETKKHQIAALEETLARLKNKKILHIPLPLHHTSKGQAQALIGNASAQIIALCEETRKPLVLENLDFKKKKAQLREKDPSYSRMLSAFAYASIIAHLKSRGASKRVAVYSVNPAFTSLIGRVKFAKRYGLTIHMAAALCIGRRFLGVSERMPQGQREIPDGKGGHVTLDLPARNRSRHVWRQWGQLNKKLSAALTAHFRAVHTDPRVPQTTPVTAMLSNLAGETPARESSTRLLC